MNELWGKVKNGVINNIFIIIVGVACLAYISYGIIDISETGKSVTQIIMDGAIAFLFATFIIKMFDIDALKRGNKIEVVINKQKDHEKVANEVAEHCDLLEKWCLYKNKQAYITARTRILEAVGIKYSDYENKKINIDALTKEQRQAVHKADKVKITKLSTNYLLSETAKTNDPHNIGRSKIDYERSTELTSMFSRIATMLIAGYYSVDLITSANLMSLVWAFVQVVFFLLMGGLRWGQTYLYMNDEYPNFIQGKINYLKEFLRVVESGEMQNIIEEQKEQNFVSLPIVLVNQKKESEYGELLRRTEQNGIKESAETEIGKTECANCGGNITLEYASQSGNSATNCTSSCYATYNTTSECQSPTSDKFDSVCNAKPTADNGDTSTASEHAVGNSSDDGQHANTTDNNQ